MAEVNGANLWQLIVARADATPDARMAVDENDREITFGEYRTEVERAAAGLHKMGVKEGVVVSWQLPTWFESMILVGALSRLGATQNPILPIYREREVGFCTKQTGAALYVCPNSFEEMVRGVAKDNGGTMDVLICDKELPQGDPALLPAAPSAADGEAVRWVFYTSGTTSDPKGAKHTDQTVDAAARWMNESLAITDEDRATMVFPFTHIGGITWLFSTLITGCQLVFVESFFSPGAIDVLSKHDSTICGAGTVFHQAYLAKQKELGDEKLFPNVRVFVGGGAPKPPQLHYDMKETFGVGITTGYGLTEAPIVVMARPTHDDESLAHTEGEAGTGVDLKFVSIDGKVCGTGEEGELRIKAPQLMKGYLDSSLDADAFDDEGYFRSGDLGHVDDKGMVHITGRLKDVIIRKGENVSAKEVEDELFTHPKVGDCAVIGVPDDERGEMVVAVIQTADGQSDITFDEMVEHCKISGMMMQKVPERLEIIAAIPRNPTGKIVKFELRDTYSN